MYDSKQTGIRLRNLRTSFHYSRALVAEHIQRSEKYYADIERGTCGMSLDTLLELADFYHVSLDYLVFGERDETMPDPKTHWALQQFLVYWEKKRSFMNGILELLEDEERTE